ncbi:hypothetical protein MYCTH_2295606 [Thermothelomyces thermophilus ATCC 42464]|uniref:Uncharacterized protein n=1 Tax=Thermothelomyces thermophilus (strain ATCC 42464 / BCRC 31852 / DSM 1799) TaxID=573729 RepID=G2Q5G6_THET4|nr:uncharacterized protein MYCTH_2295606 [Thermothelomyces thermophilus ATCC 42464]AEO53797.1 hypothetical protein MYCTH_2295606 [Thermothelomyces thermophilus ATCC 42464]
MDHKPIHVDGVGLAGQDASEVNEVSRQNAKDGPLGTPMVDSMSMFDRHDASKNYVLANPAKQPTTSPHRSDPPSEDLRGRVPRTSEPFDVIALSSQSPTTEYVVTAPTSPMFVERSHEHMAAEGVAGVSLSDKRSGPNQETPALSAIERSSPSRITPPSTQPRAQGHDGEIKRRHTEHHLPSRIIDAFLSDDQQQAKSSPSTVLEPEFCSKQSLSPEEAWKQAVEDGSPPAILHRIITLLHRSLKPREEVVRDIATDYQKNAISLLETLSARHEEEKAKAAAALRKASRSAFSICSSAKQDIVVLVNTLRGMNVTQTAETIRRPGLAQKLDALSRLCQAELSNSTQDAPTENDASGASENNLNSLTETYRRRLVEAVRRPDALASGASDVVRSQVDDFMKRCLLADEVKEVHCTKGKQAGTSVKNADDALEAFLEGIIGTLQESKGRTVCNQPATKDLVAIDSDTSDLNVLA